MAGKRKKTPRGPGEQEGPDWSLPRAPEKLVSPFKGALSALKQQLAAEAASKEPKQV
jgi:hypothetical protein